MSNSNSFRPLADRMRPSKLEEYVGQSHLLGPGKPLRKLVESGHIHSMILWGPPGTGKTTLARIFAHYANAKFITLSAVLSGLKDIRAAVDQAKILRSEQDRSTLLFVDEVHRFNKIQQDSFLPHVEQGLITIIGATTENPSFELNNALLSRSRVYQLHALNEKELGLIVDHSLDDPIRGLGANKIKLHAQAKQMLIKSADGDARQVLNLLEYAANNVSQENATITVDIIKEVLVDGACRFDNRGDYFYDQISALHKSVRGSSPDAALYWMGRMLESGCDPLYIARRLVRMASEDIGNADPRSLQLALNAWEVQKKLGSPEGHLALAQAVTYLACAPKSNAVYVAFKEVKKDIKKHGSLEVPMHLRNAPTSLMKELGYAEHYRYSHDEANAYSPGQTYFPDKMVNKHYYQPSQRGLEKKIAEKLAYLKYLDDEAKKL